MKQYSFMKVVKMKQHFNLPNPPSLFLVPILLFAGVELKISAGASPTKWIQRKINSL